MKIAIMTQPLGANYGGIMQAWALQQVLKRMGHEPVTIDRQTDSKKLAYRAMRLAYRMLKKITGNRKASIFIERHLSNTQVHTRAFIRQNITMSEPLESTKKLKAHFGCEQYDAVIVGSDQTWRPQYSPNIRNFFLDFLEGKSIKRIAYASSFGVRDWEFTKAQTKDCAELSRKFDAISVREDSGVDLCSKYLGVEAQHVLDPTLLLEKKDYEELIGLERLKEKKVGIFTYFLDETPEKISFARQVGEKMGEIVHSHLTDYDKDECAMPDPRDWLLGFANANYILTDSFHGMIFSIIFKKPFLLFSNHARGESRFESLISQINLTHNWDPRTSAVKFYSHSQSDLLNKLISNSIAFLEKNLTR